jgi:hypothetical protein
VFGVSVSTAPATNPFTPPRIDDPMFGAPYSAALGIKVNTSTPNLITYDKQQLIKGMAPIFVFSVCATGAINPPHPQKGMAPMFGVRYVIQATAKPKGTSGHIPRQRIFGKHICTHMCLLDVKHPCLPCSPTPPLPPPISCECSCQPVAQEAHINIHHKH